MAKYPSQIDTSVSLPTAVDNLTPVQGAIFNRLRDAVIAIEHELGVKPSASYSTVRARIDALETALGNLQIIELAGDLGGTLETPKVIGIQGFPVSDAEPTLNQVLSWNGISWSPATVSGGGGGGSQTLAETLALGASANNIIISDLADPESAQDAATQAYVLSRGARVVFINDFADTIEAGFYVEVNVPVPGTSVGDLCGAYMTSTSATSWPNIEFSVRATFSNVVKIRLKNTGLTDAVISSGSLTYYVQSIAQSI